MKTKKSNDIGNNRKALHEKAEQLAAKASAAEKLADTARAHWRGLKVEQKQARKAFKQAKKAAKLARREAKLGMIAARAALGKTGRSKQSKVRKSKAPKRRAPPRAVIKASGAQPETKEPISVVIPAPPLVETQGK